jgi:hypothetical protein
MAIGAEGLDRIEGRPGVVAHDRDEVDGGGLRRAQERQHRAGPGAGRPGRGPCPFAIGPDAPPRDRQQQWSRQGGAGAGDERRPGRIGAAGDAPGRGRAARIRRLVVEVDPVGADVAHQPRQRGRVVAVPAPVVGAADRDHDPGSGIALLQGRDRLAQEGRGERELQAAAGQFAALGVDHVRAGEAQGQDADIARQAGDQRVGRTGGRRLVPAGEIGEEGPVGRRGRACEQQPRRQQDGRDAPQNTSRPARPRTTVRTMIRRSNQIDQFSM